MRSLRRPRVLLLGPARSAVSGVSTHLNQLFESELLEHFDLLQFQIGSEGRTHGRLRTLLRLIAGPFAFAACLIRSNPLIVHINTSLVPKGYWRDIIFLALAKAMGRKVIYQVHGGALPAEFFAGNRVLTALLRRVLSWPDMVVLLALAEMAAYGHFAPRARLVRIANAVTVCEADLTAERYIVNRPLQVVYIGRLDAEKGIFDTIEAIEDPTRSRTIVQLTIAGFGPARRKIDLRYRGRSPRRSSLSLEAVFGSAKQQLWKEADVFAFPTYREGLPYALLEAMAAGAVPVISPVGAIPDVVQDEVHGLFVPAREPQVL